MNNRIARRIACKHHLNPKFLSNKIDSIKMRQKQPKPQRVCRRFRSYTQENIARAFYLVKSRGVPVYKAARRCGVPYTTLFEKTCGKNNLGGIWGKQPLLSREEEEKLVKHLTEQAKYGYGVTRKLVKQIATEILNTREGQRRDKDNQLTDGWFRRFMRRWPTLKVRKPQKLTINRATATSEQTVTNYFKELERILRKYSLEKRPDLIYNVDETGFQEDHTPPKVVAPKNTTLNSISSSRGSTTTVLVTANAIGNTLPPYFVFKGKRANDDLMKGAAPGSGYSMSDTGWSNSDIFLRYFKDHFLKYVTPRGDQKVLLLYDGHTSHVTIPLIEYARDHGVVLFVLPAHTSHVLQPLDVGCFGPVKKAYDVECANFLRRNPGQVVTRLDMTKLLSDALQKAMTPGNICQSFRKCGIFPFNPLVINSDAYKPAEGLQQPHPHAAPEQASVSAEIDQILDSHSTATKEKPRKKSRKTQYRAAGVAITETSILLKLRKVQEERADKQAKNTRAVRSQTTKDVPGTSGAAQTRIVGLDMQLPRKTVTDLPSEDTQDDDENCCVCGRWSPPALKKYRGVDIVGWAQCDACDHWTHLKYCCTTTTIAMEDVFYCPHCMEE